MERYILIGLRGTGKSTIGRILAGKLALPFFDTDKLIEKEAGCSIGAIFSSSGEEAFREMEHTVISRLPRGPAVIATGGGAVLDERNRLMLRRDSHIIHLTADPETLEERTRRGGRPPLTSLDPTGEIRHLQEIRGPLYRGLADICLNTKGETARDVAEMINRSGGIPARSLDDFGSVMSRIGSSAIEDLIESPQLFGITGNPVSHSRSPHLYNTLFPEYSIPARYLFFQADSALDAVSMMQAAGAKGLSVTIPFKETMISAIDRPDAGCDAIGAVNTVVSCDGTLYGHNTDWIGIQLPLSGLKGSDALVIGAGGAAAAAVYALQALAMDVTIINRNMRRGEALAERFGCSAAPVDQIQKADLIVNATPLGMKDEDELPVPGRVLQPGVTVFDLVYTPPLTPLLKKAKAAGCAIIPGTEMFIHQAAAQFQLLTGITPDINRIREVMAS
ncbi:MAG: shikimate dehydrogenase [Methanocalculus sp. MSAO_Arc1]|uniref:shikimate dehydrogenase n=1 Tax=Methanocalculus TaxID=71151 RepID=UPI000FEEFCE0|nr:MULTISPECIES: shikimate dehydrogenase [unclassified Methanocalculus]MCP1661741.1 shikimate dehydrogenase [Methanocalculus sp. AMF5]RQD79386.1 MAG: shikimate dehydrogenase [Methanocalculus sp. MSAO_Arc1]